MDGGRDRKEKKNEKTIVVHARLPLKIEEDLKSLIEEGYYSNMSDALRDAARRLVQEHKYVLAGKKKPPKFELREVRLGGKKKSKG